MIAIELCGAFIEAHPHDSARCLEASEPASAADLIARLPAGTAATAIGGMNPEFAATAFSKLPDEVRSTIVERLPLPQAAGLLQRMPKEEQNRFADLLPADVRQPLLRLLRYPEGTAGATMDPHYPCLPEDLALAEALELVRRARDRGAFYLFVIDRRQKLTGIISVLELLAPDEHARVGDLKRRCGRQLSALTRLESLRASPELVRWNALPVVDEKGVYLGAVRQRAVAGMTPGMVPQATPVSVAGAALGELFQLGLFGLAGSIEAPAALDREFPTSRR